MGFVVMLSIDVSTGTLTAGSLARGRTKYEVSDLFTAESGHCAFHRYVRYGSNADMCCAIGDVRFTPNSDRESRHAAMVMSALPPKADMCSAMAHVGFGPKADNTCAPFLKIVRCHSD